MYLFRVFQHLLRIQLTRSGSWVVLSLLLDSPPSDLAICPKTLMGSFSTPGCTPGWQMASSWCVCLVCFSRGQFPCLSLPFKTWTVWKSREHSFCRMPSFWTYRLPPRLAHVVVVGMSWGLCVLGGPRCSVVGVACHGFGEVSFGPLGMPSLSSSAENIPICLL